MIAVHWRLRDGAAALAETPNRRSRRLSPLLADRSRHDAGVRGVVLDGDNKVFLVRHSYVAGWHLPGGGVEVGDFLEALRRELVEEGRIELTGEPALHGLFFTATSPAATMSPSISSGNSGRTACRRRIMRSWSAASMSPAGCRPRPPRGRAFGSPKCSTVRHRSRRGARVCPC